MEQARNTLKLVAEAISNQAKPEVPTDNDRHITRGLSPSASSCEWCDGTGFEVLLLIEGKGAKRCRCRVAKEREAMLAVIPPKFGNPCLNTLSPRPDLHANQAKLVEALRANPDGSFLLYGLNGVGKTFFGWALYRRAAEEGRKAIAAKLDELLVEYRRFELQRQDDPESYWRPRVLSEDLRQTDRRYSIFLDELEKSTPTEFAAKRFFALVDAAQEFGHQLILTSNLSPERLQVRWSREDEVWGNSIARRIAQSCTVVDMS